MTWISLNVEISACHEILCCVGPIGITQVL